MAVDIKKGPAKPTADRGSGVDRDRSIRRFQLSRISAECIERQESEGGNVYRLNGYASVTDTWYDVDTFFGSFRERIAGGAFQKSLDTDPQVIARINHEGLQVGSTRNGTVELSEDGIGLRTSIDIDPERTDAMDAWRGVKRGDITEMSFAGWVTDFEEEELREGQWLPDWTITEIDIDRGDVAIVSYGANPNTMIGAEERGRAQESMRARKEAAAMLVRSSEIALPPAAGIPQ